MHCIQLRAFFETAFKYDVGQHIVLEDAWGKLLQSVEKVDRNYSTN